MKLDLSYLQKTLPLTIEYFDTIDSTSLYLKRCIKEEKLISDVVVAGFQTNGQGRTGKSFYSPEETGLYLTFAFKETEISCDDITARIALAVSSAIDKVFSVNTGIKWVNDIYLNEKKISGVLCQKIGSYHLIGIGINVEAPKSIPSDLADRFGSICDSCDKEKYTHLFLSLYEEIVSVISRSKDEVLDSFRAKCIHLGKIILIEQNNETLSGLCEGISDDFSLLVNINGKTHSFSSGFMTIKI